MRIVGGSAKGRHLEAPEGWATRPTGDGVREAVFNSLFSMGGVTDLDCADLFAGTGALGIEALSRGARRCVFVETDRRALTCLRHNITTTRVEGAEVVQSDVLRWVNGPTGHFDVVFADPPYVFDAWDQVLEHLDADLVVIESDREIDPPDGWSVRRSRRYGSTVVTFVQRTDHLHEA